jgi:hypothetical protein
MKESGWCWPTIASGHVYGGQFTASTSSSRPFLMPAGQEALRYRTGDEVDATSAETASLANHSPACGNDTERAPSPAHAPATSSSPGRKSAGRERINKLALEGVQCRRRFSRTKPTLELMPSHTLRANASGKITALLLSLFTGRTRLATPPAQENIRLRTRRPPYRQIMALLPLNRFVNH